MLLNGEMEIQGEAGCLQRLWLRRTESTLAMEKRGEKRTWVSYVYGKSGFLVISCYVLFGGL